MKSSVGSFLLDTHTFLWWITDSLRLSAKVRQIMQDADNKIFLSAVSGWEIAIKAALGKLKEVGDPELSVTFHAERNNIVMKDFPMQAALRIFKLPPIHQDPFDRALIAHAQMLEVPIITSDPTIKKYKHEVIW